MAERRMSAVELLQSGRMVRVSAPMVRYSKLAFRSLVRRYGCDLCFTPMILADAFARSLRARDSEFTTNAADRPLIVQFAANDPYDLAAASLAVTPYADGVDLNCGCPQRTANKCLLKVAAYAAQLEQYLKAIEIYEQVGTSTMDSSLLKINARESFFKAAVCHFCVDALNAQIAVEKYEQMFPAFADSRECKFVKKLLEAHEENNLEAFTETVKEFDSGARMDQWMTTMLLRIKKTIPDDSEGDMR
ncbi:unnamed protein product [Lampetra fluviatilis]